jgi:histidinol dehydrogenase
MSERAGPVMPVRRWADLDPVERDAVVARPWGLAMFDDELRASIVALVDDVRARGDAAVVDALARFDGCSVDPGDLRVGQDEIAAARERVAPAVVDALRDAIDHVRRFNERVVAEREWRAELDPGLTVGERSTAVASAGLFVPSGKGSFPSVLVQLGTPAVVAGVPEIAVVVPPVPGGDGEIDPAVLVVADELGLRTVLRANGPAGVAALAFGTESFPRVRKVVGPGSPPVACAQIEVQRHGCHAQVLLGPSESLILADGSADPDGLALDLLNEAEHGPDSSSVLVCDDEGVVDAVQERLAVHLAALPEPRRGYAARALGRNGGAVLVADMVQGAEVADLYAPEHMVLVARDDEAVLGRLHHAGEVLLGACTPVSAANYVLGVPAALPTGRFARVTGGVTSDAFLKRMSIARANEEALRRLAPTILALADHEGFPAHANAVRARLDRYGRDTERADRT